MSTGKFFSFRYIYTNYLNFFLGVEGCQEMSETNGSCIWKFLFTLNKLNIDMYINNIYADGMLFKPESFG